ncbi:hypothetical protein ACFE04_017544 [Oxalis oulophora]
MRILYIISLFLVSIPTSFAFLRNNNQLTAYEVLKQYNLPVGLLPRGVVSYTLDNSTNRFEVNFPATCSVKLQRYEVKFNSRVTGIISKDRVSRLNGIKVKDGWFLNLIWFGLDEIKHQHDHVVFSVGFMDRDFDMENFDESATCETN